LGRHPVAYFIVNLLKHRQQKAFETICYSDRKPDDMTKQFMDLSDEWTDARGISDEALSQRIRSDQIDILIDLSGHTAGNRLLVVARKPAPIQVTWAGYVGTTGLSAIDYLIADYRHVPEGAERLYTEKVIRLPDGYVSYEPPDYALEVGSLPFEQNGFITFGSFNNPAKINDDVRIILKYKNMDAEGNRDRFYSPFDTHGIERSRLILEGKSPHAELLGRYNDVDLALDTFPYTGGLTTCEAVWMGVPVITVPGETFASRHSLSHLTNIGVPELVADDVADYVAKAVELANDIPRLSVYRSGLRDQMANSPLCDGVKFARDFTSAMRDIWREWCYSQNR
jgi:protein O-GlcNAc transferase